MSNLNCGCESLCTCQQCPPAPCTEGCLTDTKTDCVFLSEDLDICSEILPKGSPVTEALAKLGEAVCDGVTVTVQDMKVKVDSSDTTTGYLFDKVTVGNSLSKTVTNPAGNETLRLDAKLDTVTAGNILSITANGLYVPTPLPSGYNLTSLFSSTVNLTIASVLGGQSIKADAKISPNAGNLLVDNGGLYVAMPSVGTPITISKLNTNSINTSLSLLGSNYEISSNLRIDPSSTAPISITSQGLKVDCCLPVIPSNTPISVVLGSTSCMAMTATGIDNHVLTPSVVVSPSAGNALTATVNGLYCPAPGAAAATTINDTPTVDATLVSPGVYTLAVKKSTDTCNALVNGTDGGLYVNGVEEPNSLGFVTDITDIFFEFQGPSTTDTDYIVELQGTTGSPTSWIPASFDGLFGPVLRYNVGSTAITETIRARVKYVCGANESNWVGETYYPPLTLVSEDNSITITPGTSGLVNEFNIEVTPNPSACETVGWLDVPNTAFITTAPGGNTLTVTNLTNIYKLKYKITKDNTLHLRGFVNFSQVGANPWVPGTDTGWYGFLKLGDLTSCVSTWDGTQEIFSHSAVDGLFDYTTDTLSTLNADGTEMRGVLIRRDNTTLKFRVPNASDNFLLNQNLVVYLSHVKIVS